MTENEMLEAAALAVGKEISFGPEGVLFRQKGEPHWKGWWNPHYNNGDAFELAAILRLTIKPGKHLGDGCTVEADGWGVPITSCTAFRNDPLEQMRIAICIVAAEIGVTIYGYKSKEKELK